MRCYGMEGMRVYICLYHIDELGDGSNVHVTFSAPFCHSSVVLMCIRICMVSVIVEPRLFVVEVETAINFSTVI